MLASLGNFCQPLLATAGAKLTSTHLASNYLPCTALGQSCVDQRLEHGSYSTASVPLSTNCFHNASAAANPMSSSGQVKVS